MHIMTNTQTFKGLNAAGKAIAATFDSRKLIVERVDLIVGFLLDNPTASQNTALKALAESIESNVDSSLIRTGFKAANLGHYARVAKVLDDLAIKRTEATIMAVYRLQLNARDALDSLKIKVASEVPAKFPAKRATMLVEESARIIAELKETERMAKAEKEAEAKENKSKVEAAESAETGDDDGDIVAKSAEAMTARDYATMIGSIAGRKWSPEDAQTILAAIVDIAPALTKLAEPAHVEA